MKISFYCDAKHFLATDNPLNSLAQQLQAGVIMHYLTLFNPTRGIGSLTTLSVGLSLLLGATTSIMAQDQMPGSQGTVSNDDGSASITINTPHIYAPVFLAGDSYSSAFTLPVLAAHQGQEADLYLAGTVDDNWFIKTAEGWSLWDPASTPPVPYGRAELGNTITLHALDDEPLPAGDFEVYAAYQVLNQEPVIAADPLRFRVMPADEETLHPFGSAADMETYLKQGLQSSSSNQVYALDALTPGALLESDGVNTNSRASGTNLQEAGVDEADSIKSDGEHLFILRNCSLQSCLVSYELDATEPAAVELASIELAGSLPADGMYLVEEDDLLITVGGRTPGLVWFDVWYWANTVTELEFFDISKPESPETIEALRLDGQLVSSRRVDDVLYLVTRYTPGIEGFVPYAYDEEIVQENNNLLATTSLEDLLPQITDASAQPQDLVSSQDCYLPTKAVDRPESPTIITITALPLSSPQDYSSTCFLGDTEALYMTPDSLYLATTRYPYAFIRPNVLAYDPQHTTSIHKFDLQGTTINYQGSGQVKGHLGWSEDKKSFRMGENGDFLNVVTSVGDTWNESSSTRLTVLNGNDEGTILETVAIVDGIGKPGEQLYAARFLGDKAYLVTFRLTDPFYVVDLSDQENPQITGELEIDGYSDYLHPVAENLILGIGKDAIPDDLSSDFGGTRGAWYQGLKLALFDVSDPTQPSEVDTVVIGKRGTHSALLDDHHALSFLPATIDQPARLAIPVDLHDTLPNYPGFDPDNPSAWYDYTHTGLYSFEIDANNLSQVGIVFGTEPSYNLVFGNYTDRSVLVDDAIFYIHQGEVIASGWEQD